MPFICRAKEKLEATHHKFQRGLLGVSWKDKVRNEEVRQQTNLKEEMNLIIKERRLLEMAGSCIMHGR